MDPRQPTLGEEDRFQLEMRARASERRNRSMGVVVLAAVVLVVCAGVWFWGLRARASAFRLLRVEQRRAVDVEAKLMRLEALQSQGTGQAEGRPIANMGTRVANIADEVGLGDLPFPQESTRNMAGGVVKIYRYEEISAKRLEPMIEWLVRATTEIPGLELYQLTIDPNETRKEWNAVVHFRRWERAQ